MAMYKLNLLRDMGFISRFISYKYVIAGVVGIEEMIYVSQLLLSYLVSNAVL